MKILTDNDCKRAGWIGYMAFGNGIDLHVSVSPRADLECEILAFDHDEQEMIWVNGWLFKFEAVQ